MSNLLKYDESPNPQHMTGVPDAPTLEGDITLTIHNKSYLLEGNDFGLDDGWNDVDGKRTDGYLLNDANPYVQVMVKLKSPDSKKPLAITVTEIRHHKLGKLTLSDVEFENNLTLERLY